MSKTVFMILMGIILLGLGLGGLLGMAARTDESGTPNLDTPTRDRSFHD